MAGPDGQPTYFEVLTAATDDIARNGYTSPEQVDYWAEQLRLAAERSMRSEAEVERMVRDAMGAVFKKQVELGGVLRQNPGVKAYTLQMVMPELHAELSRRTAANIDLIKLNREEAVRKAQHRFRGWATSVPAGGSADLDRVQQKQDVRKSLAQLPFEDRRVIIDQGAKLFTAIDTTVCTEGGAIGADWQSHKGQPGYDGRPLHNARDGKFFLLRDSWAHKVGYVKPSSNGYTDEVEQPAQWVFCRCRWIWKFSLRSVPVECLTEKGRQALNEARAKARAA